MSGPESCALSVLGRESDSGPDGRSDCVECAMEGVGVVGRSSDEECSIAGVSAGTGGGSSCVETRSEDRVAL